MPKHVPLTDELAAYIDRHRFDHDDPLLTELIEVTRQKTGGSAGMQVSPEQGAFMSLLVAAAQMGGGPGVKTAVEVGTFTGYSSICIARALPAGGHLHCFDISETYTAVAREYWRRADLADRITLHLGPAAETLNEQLPKSPIDFAFIDADKTGYDAYFELLLPRMRRGGMLLFDNTLRGGRIADPDATGDTLALQQLNTRLVAHPKLETALLPIADGLTLSRVR